MKFEPGDHVVEWVDDALHGLLTAPDDAYVRSHTKECPICALAMEEAQKRLAAMKAVTSPEPAPAMIAGLVERIAHEETEKRRRQKFIRRWTWRAIAAGIAIVAAVHLWLVFQSTPSPYDLRILGQTELLSGSPASLRAQLVKSGTAVTGATIKMTLRGPQGNVVLASYKTDAAGTGSPRFTLPEWPEGQYTLRIEASDGLHTETLTQQIALKRESKVMLSTDKPVYQPGQTIHIRALALRRPDLKPVAANEATFSLTDPKGNVIFKQTGVTSAFGIASIDCPTATEITQGIYQLTCKIGDTESTSSVEIKHYVLPKFKVTVETDKPFYAPGDRVRATVQADYFFGQKVSGAEVELTAYTSSAGQQPLGRTTAATDASGRAVLEMMLPQTLVGTQQDNGNARLTLTARVTDSGKQEQSRTLSVIVTRSPIRIEFVPEGGDLVQGVANRIFILTTYADGRPAETRVTVAGLATEVRTNSLGAGVFELTPSDQTIALTATAIDAAGVNSSRRVELSTGFGSDYLVRTDKSVYRTGETVTLEIIGGGNEPVFVDIIKDGQTMRTATVEVKGGHGALAMDLQAELSGTLQLNAYRYDAEALPVRKQRVLYVMPADDLKIETALDRAEYRPGETAKLAFRLTDSAGKPVPGALSLSAVDEAVFSVLDAMPGLERTFFGLEKKVMEPMSALYPRGIDLYRSDGDARLLRSAVFARAAGGHPEKNALIARLISEGRIDQWQIRHMHTEWGRRSFRDSIERSNLPAEFKSVLLDPVAFPMEASTAPLNAQREWIARERRNSTMPLLWGGLVVVVGLTLMLMYARGSVLGVLVVIMIMGLLIAILLPSLGKARMQANRGEAASSDIARHGLNATMIDLRAEYNDLRGESATPRLRQFFPETLLWRPELITNDRGEVTLEIPLADSITTWRLSTSAVSASGQLGAFQNSIKVFQPFFVDLNLPPTLTRNDEVSVPAVVYNYLPTAQTVTLQLDRANPWFELLDDAEKTVALAPGEVKSTSFRIRALRPGQQHLKITARAGDVADAIQRDILIVPDGHLVEATQSGTFGSGTAATVPVNVPGNAIEGSVKTLVKIYPSTFSQVVEGLENVFRMPYGCFEQTSSTTYPNVLALDYLRRTKVASPEVEAKARQYIHLGYQRLVGFEVNGGGFDWFGRPPANRTLTAYGLMEFQDMAAVHNVDTNLIDRTRKWLLNQQRSDGTWELSNRLHGDPTTTGDAQLANTAYIAWAAFHDGAAISGDAADRTRRYLASRANEARRNPYTAALVANALLAMDPRDPAAQSLLGSLEESKQMSPDRKQAHWSPMAGASTAFYGRGRSADVETTALAALAMSRAGGHAVSLNAALSWLVASKDSSGTWQSTQATVLALKALVAGTNVTPADAQERRIALEIDGRIVREITIPADQSDVMQLIDISTFITPGTNQTLRLIPRTGPEMAWQVVTAHHLPGPAPATPNAALQIQITYDRSQLSVGERIQAIARLRNASAETLPMVMLDLPIPPGFAPETETLESLLAAGTIEKYQTTSRQIIVYLRALNPATTLTIPYTLRATMPVKVQANPATAYEYYRPENRATGGETQLETK